MDAEAKARKTLLKLKATFYAWGVRNGITTSMTKKSVLKVSIASAELVKSNSKFVVVVTNADRKTIDYPFGRDPMWPEELIIELRRM